MASAGTRGPASSVFGASPSLVTLPWCGLGSYTVVHSLLRPSLLFLQFCCSFLPRQCALVPGGHQSPGGGSAVLNMFLRSACLAWGAGHRRRWQVLARPSFAYKMSFVEAPVVRPRLFAFDSLQPLPLPPGTHHGGCQDTLGPGSLCGLLAGQRL